MLKLRTFMVVALTLFTLGVLPNQVPAFAEGLPSPSDPVVAVGPNNSGLVLSWKIDESRVYTKTTVTKIDGSLDGIVWTRLSTQPWWKTTLSISKLADSWKYFSIALVDGWAESDWTDPIDSSVHKKFFTTGQSLQKRHFKAQVVPQGYLFGWAESPDQTGLEAPLNTAQYVQLVVKKGNTTMTASSLASPNMAFIKSKIKPGELITGSATFVYRNGYVEKVPIKFSTPKTTPKFFSTEIDVHILQDGRVLDKLIRLGEREEITIAIQTSVKEPLFTCNVQVFSGTVTARLDSSGMGSVTFPTAELSAANGFNDMPIECYNPRTKGSTYITLTITDSSCECWPYSSFLEFIIPKS
jgi:hypothetical protein